MPPGRKVAVISLASPSVSSLAALVEAPEETRCSSPVKYALALDVGC